MVHVSFDYVKEFVPRVPKQRCPREDSTIPRICVSDTLLHSLQSIPQAGEVFVKMKQLNLPILIQAYYLKCNKILNNDEVIKYVADAECTKETWLLEKPYSIFHITYEITDFLAPFKTDRYGTSSNFIMAIDFKKVKRQNNWDSLYRKFSMNDNKVSDLQEFCKDKNISFRTLLSNLTSEEINSFENV